MARDLGVSPSAFEDFAYGRASLTPDVLKVLALHSTPSTCPRYDKLRNADRQEPRSMGKVPPRITDTMQLPTWTPGAAQRRISLGAQQQPPSRKPGWA